MPVARTPTARIPNTEFVRLRAWLYQKGLRLENIDAGIGTAPNDRTRLQLTQELRMELRQLKKAKKTA